jgi:hypothetical protein
MPYKWVEPEVAYKSPTTTIYHTYKSDWFDEPLQYWFTADGAGTSHDTFDIREWRLYDSDVSALLNLERAVDCGHIDSEGPTSKFFTEK